MSGFVVTVTREAGDLDLLDETEIVGPFRTLARAVERAGVIRRLAEQYEDPEGVTGPENFLLVAVEPLRAGGTSAKLALDYLYGAVD